MMTVEIDEKMALAMMAGACAISHDKRCEGSSYMYDVFGKNPREISFYEAKNLLGATAQEVLEKEAHSDGKE